MFCSLGQLRMQGWAVHRYIVVSRYRIDTLTVYIRMLLHTVVLYICQYRSPL